MNDCKSFKAFIHVSSEVEMGQLVRLREESCFSDCRVVCISLMAPEEFQAAYSKLRRGTSVEERGPFFRMLATNTMISTTDTAAITSAGYS